MIVITQHKNGLSIRGHAHYAEIGKDIVCAAVSSLAQTLIYSIEELTADKIEYVSKPGLIEIKYGALSNEAKLLLDSFWLGASLIASNYPQNITLENSSILC